MVLIDGAMRVDKVRLTRSFYQDIAMAMVGSLIVETTKVNHNDRGCLYCDDGEY